MTSLRALTGFRRLDVIVAFRQQSSEGAADSGQTYVPRARIEACRIAANDTCGQGRPFSSKDDNIIQAATGCLTKLLQEPDIPLEKQLNVIDAIFENRDTLDAHAKRKS